METLRARRNKRRRRITVGDLKQPELKAIRKSFSKNAELDCGYLKYCDIDHDAVDLNYELCRTHSEIISRIDRITSDLTVGGFLFIWFEIVQRIGGDFQRLVATYWKSFVRDAVKAILNIGLLPVYIRQLDNGDHVPIVPNNGSYRISVLEELGGTQRYILRWLNVNDTPGYPGEWVDRRAIVIGGWGYDPSGDGSLSCLISSLLIDMYFIIFMKSCAIVAEKQLSDPTAVVSQPKEDMQEDDEVGQFLDCHPSEVDEGDKFTGWQQGVPIRKVVISSHLKTLATEGIEACAKNIEEELLESNEQTMNTDNSWELQPGQSIINRQLPQPRTDLVPLDKLLEEKIGTTLGVPTEMMSPASTVTANTVLAKDIYKDTIIKWWDIMNDVLTYYIYEPIYGKDDKNLLNYIVNLFEGEHREQAREVCDGQIMSVVINISHLVSKEDIEHARNRGLISWETYRKSWASRLALPECLLENKSADPLTMQERLSMLPGKRNMTSSSPSNQQQQPPSSTVPKQQEKSKEGLE